VSIAKGTALGPKATRRMPRRMPQPPKGPTPVHTGAARHAKDLTVAERVAAAQGKAEVVAYWQARRRRVCVEPSCKTPLPITAPARIARCEACRMAQRVTASVRRDTRRAAGLCITCPEGKERPAEKGGRCGPCRKKIRKTQAAKGGRNATRDARDAAGLCIECGGPRVGEVYKRCQGCRDVATEKERQRRKDMAKVGRCTCGRKAVAKGKRCKKCRAQRRARDAERKEEVDDG